MSDDWRSEESPDESGAGSSSDEPRRDFEAPSQEPGQGFGEPPPQPPGWSGEQQPTWQSGPQSGGEYGQGSYAPQGYGEYGQYGYAPPKTNTMSVAALISGVLTFVCGVTWPLALVFGYMGRRQVDESQGRETGRGLAVAGIVLGWIGAALTVLTIIAFIIIFFAAVPFGGDGGFAP